MLQNVRIILAETSHTGNMGSVARVMKTMDSTNPWLVNPLVKPDSQAIALTVGASDVISNAQIVDTLDEALASCNLVVGTSVRPRTLPWLMLDSRERDLKSVAEGQYVPAALVLGRERVGPTNEELQKCHYHVTIVANPEYSSLNLAVAVQVTAYEVWMVWLATQGQAQPTIDHEGVPYPLVGDLERFYGHLEQTLLAMGLIHPSHPGQAMSKLRRLFTRARPESQEPNILRGTLASIEQQNKGK